MTSQALSTDLYEITMMAGYHAAGLMPQATFELYVRRLPPRRGFLIAAGLDQALDYLERVRFPPDDIAWLRTLPELAHVHPAFFDEYLPKFRFTGDVWAIQEGTPVFPPAPMLRVTAPLPEAQFVETALLALISFQTSVASRAVRMVEAAAGRTVVEFGARRAHGLEAGVLAGRAACLGGCAATSSVEAARRFGLAASGTMAHSWVMAFPDERSAFRKYAEVFAEHAVLLLDTYDTIAAARSIVASGLRPHAVRLDSGDIVTLSRRVRGILDEGGLRQTAIFVSGDLDEWRIADIVSAGAPVDGFGVGAALSTVSDAPSLGAVYKLVELEREGRPVPIMKFSEGKHTYPGARQVWRLMRNGMATQDIVELETAGPGVPGLSVEARGAAGNARPLLQRVMHRGLRESPPQAVSALRAYSRAEVATLPPDVRRLDPAQAYPVRLGPALQAAIDRAVAQHERP